MIVLDTHIWIWWIDNNAKLTAAQLTHLQEHEATGLCVSAISVWEVAKLVERGRISFSRSLAEWISGALQYPGIRLIDLTPDIAVESTTLPGAFHKDPADQIIVATARILKCSLLTVDERILSYPHVQVLK